MIIPSIWENTKSAKPPTSWMSVTVLAPSWRLPWKTLAFCRPLRGSARPMAGLQVPGQREDIWGQPGWDKHVKRFPKNEAQKNMMSKQSVGVWFVLIQNSTLKSNKHSLPMPICSMYGIFINIYPINDLNIGTHSIHGASGMMKRFEFSRCNLPHHPHLRGKLPCHASSTEGPGLQSWSPWSVPVSCLKIHFDVSLWSSNNI